MQESVSSFLTMRDTFPGQNRITQKFMLTGGSAITARDGMPHEQAFPNRHDAR